MVRIPVYDSERPLNVGSEFFRPLNTEQAEKDMSRGFNSAAAGLGAFAGVLERDQQRDDKFRTDAMLLDFADVSKKTMEEEAAENMPRDGRGFHNTVMTKLTKTANDVLNSVPESQRQYAELKLQSSVFDLSNSALRAEKDQQRGFVSEVTKGTLQRVEENVKLGAWDQKRAEAEIDSFLSGSGLSDNQKTQMRDVMVKTASLARVEHLRATKPELFLRDAQKYLPNAPRADATEIQKTVAYQATAYGEDPRQVLLTGLLESSFNPNAGGKGTIKGMFQMSKFERGRLAAKLGVSEESLASDPATAAAGMAILNKEARTYLESNGIPATPLTMYASHFLGKSGALHFLRADPETDALTLYSKLDPKAVAAGAFQNNPGLLQPGMTVGQVLAAIDGKVQKGLVEVDKILVGNPVDKNAPVEIMGEKIPGIVPGDIIASTTRAQAEVVKRSTDRLLDNAKQNTVATPSLANAYDPSWRKEQDDIERKEQHGQKILTGDQNLAAYYSNYAAQHGYLPVGVVAAARKMINTPGSADMQLRGYELLASIAKADNVNGLKNSKVGGDQDTVGNNDAAKIRDYVALTTHMGYGQDPVARLNAIQQIEKTHSEDWKVKEARVVKDRENLARARTFGEISTKLDLQKGWLRGLFSSTGSYDKRPQDAAVQNRIQEMYQGRFRYWYTETGNKDIAIANSISDINRSVGWSRLSGSPVMTMHPAESYYPPAVQLPTRADGSYKSPSELTDKEHKAAYGYLQTQALAASVAARVADPNGKLVDLIPVKQRSSIKESDVQLVVTGNTKRDVESGRPPRYNVDVRVNGEWRQVLQDWQPDAALAKENAADGERRASNVQSPTPAPSLPQDAQNRRDAFRAKRGN